MAVAEDMLTFQIRYCRWALDEWASEIEQDFPTLRAIGANREIRAVERWPPGERLALARALAKRFHPEAASALGEPISPEDQTLIQS